MGNLQDIKTTPNSSDSGSKPQPLGMQGAVLAHSLRQLEKAGYAFEARDTPEGVVITVSHLHTTTSKNGNLVFDGVKGGAPIAAKTAQPKPQYEIRQVEAGPIGAGNRTMERLFADGWELVQSVNMHGNSNGVPVWMHTIRREAAQT